MCKNGSFAIYCHSSYGPIFGSSTGYDFVITSGSNASQASYSNFGNTYEHADFQFKSGKAKTILAGSNYFRTDEIEVFVNLDIWSISSFCRSGRADSKYIYFVGSLKVFFYYNYIIGGKNSMIESHIYIQWMPAKSKSIH